MKLLVDASLGGLVKWLRFLGFDTSVKVLKAGALPAPAADTLLVTANPRLAGAGRPDILLLRGPGREEQLAEICRRLGLPPGAIKPLSRCVRCNAPLRELPREEARLQVPEHVFLTQEEFFACPACHRVYWPGSHLAGISRTLERVLGCRLTGGASPATRSWS